MSAPRRAHQNISPPAARRRVSNMPSRSLSVRSVLAYIVVLALGAAMLAGHRPGASAPAWITLLAGLGGCAWEIGRWLRGRVVERADRVREVARTQARAEQKNVRAERRTEQRDRQQRERHTALQTRNAQKQARQAVQQTQNEREEAERARRAARFEAVRAEADRLASLPEDLWLIALKEVLALRGLRLLEEDASGNHNTLPGDTHGAWGGVSDLRFARINDTDAITSCVARSLPAGRVGVVADAESLEQWRAEANAPQAYLIGRGGFSAALVRLAPRLPLTLVEPNLLAQWKLNSDSQNLE